MRAILLSAVLALGCSSVGEPTPICPATMHCYPGTDRVIVCEDDAKGHGMLACVDAGGTCTPSNCQPKCRRVDTVPDSGSYPGCDELDAGTD